MIKVLGPVVKSDGLPFIGRMRFEPVNLETGTATINNVLTVYAKAPDGLWDDYSADGLHLAAGVWLVSFLSAPDFPQLELLVPDGADDTEFHFSDLLEPVGFVGANIDAALIELVTVEGFELTTIQRDADGVITSATVMWPAIEGGWPASAGVFTRTAKNAAFLLIDGFTITHAASGKTVTQATVTRDEVGNVTIKPALTVS